MSEFPGTLLLVDDNEINRDMLSRRLQRRGYEVETAFSGQQALDLIAARKFDLVLLDIMMPGLSGWDVLEHIRSKYSRLELPVIMATAKDESADVIQALTGGASDYVTKPFDLDVVLARVGTHVILKHTYEKLHTANRKLKEDLAAASRIQQTHLPSRTPDLKGCGSIESPLSDGFCDKSILHNDLWCARTSNTSLPVYVRRASADHLCSAS